MILDTLESYFYTIVDLSDNQKMAILIVLALLGILYKVLASLGLLHHPIIQQLMMKRSTILYVNVQGNDAVFYQTYQTILTEAQEVFKISKLFGLYHNDPRQANSKKKCRASLGVIVNDGETSKIEQFLAKFSNYKKSQLPSTKCLSIEYPYTNSLSFIMIGARVYPKLRNYLMKEDLENDALFMEVYHFLSSSGKNIEVLAPLEKFEGFDLWEKPEN